jgi:large subunit ribosomal protein L10
MSKPVKAMVTSELAKRYTGTDSACVVDLTGLNVQEQEQLRGMLKKASARLQVVKNSLARRAFEGGPLEPLGRVLKGPCALVVSSESLIETAKALVNAAEEFEKLELKDAILEGQPDLLTVVELSKLKSRKEMVGDLAFLIVSPGRAVAGCLTAPQSRIAGCLQAIVDKAA